MTLTSSANSLGTFDLTATANQSVTASGYTLSIYDQSTGARLASCTTNCVYLGTAVVASSVVPKASSRALSMMSHTYIGVLGSDSASYPPTTTVATSTPITKAPWSVQLSYSTYSLRYFQITAISNYQLQGSSYMMAIYDQTTGERVASCTPTCSSLGEILFSPSLVPKATTTALSSKPHTYV